MIGELLRSETYVTILKYIDLWGETLPETLFRGGPLVPVDVREVQGGYLGYLGALSATYFGQAQLSRVLTRILRARL